MTTRHMRWRSAVVTSALVAVVGATACIPPQLGALLNPRPAASPAPTGTPEASLGRAQPSPTSALGQPSPAGTPSPTARPGQTPAAGTLVAGTPTPARTATPGAAGGTPNATATVAAALTVTPVVFGTPGASGAVVGACQFLTKADVDAVLNASSSELGRSDSGGVSTCTYFAPGGRTVVLLVRSGTVNETRAAFENSRRFVGSEDIPNLGDEAFWTSGVTQLHIRVGGLWFILTATAPATDARQLHVQLGQRIVARAR